MLPLTSHAVTDPFAEPGTARGSLQIGLFPICNLLVLHQAKARA